MAAAATCAVTAGWYRTGEDRGHASPPTPVASRSSPRPSTSPRAAPASSPQTRATGTGPADRAVPRYAPRRRWCPGPPDGQHRAEPLPRLAGPHPSAIAGSPAARAAAPPARRGAAADRPPPTSAKVTLVADATSRRPHRRCPRRRPARPRPPPGVRRRQSAAARARLRRRRPPRPGSDPSARPGRRAGRGSTRRLADAVGRGAETAAPGGPRRPAAGARQRQIDRAAVPLTTVTRL